MATMGFMGLSPVSVFAACIVCFLWKPLSSSHFI